MKILSVLLFSILLIGSSFAQSNKWQNLSYEYSKGPVSPEYQYNYTINIDANGTGKLIYTKSSLSNEYDFTVGKKSMKKLNTALNNSEVFTVSADQMKADQNLIGGPSRSMSVTMWQDASLDQKPTVIQVPAQVNETYSNGVSNVYDLIETLVPKSVWNKTTGQ